MFPAEELILRVYPGMEGVYISRLYEDAGDGFGQYLVFRFELSVFKGALRVVARKEGDFPLPYKRLKVWVPGLFFQTAAINGKAVRGEVNSKGTELLFDPFPWQGEDPVFELLLPVPE